MIDRFPTVSVLVCRQGQGVGAAPLRPGGSLPTLSRRPDIGRAGADPGWGLADNAALVIGPRELTAGRSLDGWVFLHSYDRVTDPSGVVLEQLLRLDRALRWQPCRHPPRPT
ncbi:MAG: putative inorganic carbon transporter subunit DabA [Ornithinibacter sp.]